MVSEGRAKYQAGQPLPAIEILTRALEAMPQTAETRRERTDLVLDLAAAHIMAHEIEADVKLLRRAKVILSAHRDALSSFYPEAEIAAARARVDGRMREVDDKLAGEPPPATVPPKAATAAPPPSVQTSATAPPPTVSAARHMKGAGLAVMALSLLPFTGAIIALVVHTKAENDLDAGPSSTAERDDLERKYLHSGRAGFSLLIITGVMFAAGATVAIVGKARENKARRALALAPGGVGLRF
jgi:hypothetical protein